MSTNSTMILTAAHNDAAHYGGHIDLKTISEGTFFSPRESCSVSRILTSLCTADARRLMSAEHKALGFRPPPGSLAAEAQAEAAKHPNTPVRLSAEELRKAALADAERIKGLRAGTNELNLNTVGAGKFASLAVHILYTSRWSVF